MTIFDVLTLIGGIALFLYGMHIMGNALTKAAGNKLEGLLERLTKTTIMGVLLGAGVTAVIQSSGATTVMVVGFVNSGIMKLEQAVGIIMGANIGTTITAWILSLTGIQGDSIFVNMLKPTSWTPILALIGIIFVMFMKDEKKHDIGEIFLGFAVLMFGMNTMTTAAAPLANMPSFTNMLLKFSNPVFGIIAGTVLTAALQSSSASVGILQALCMTGTVTYGVALPIIMGQNIGTCVTALISAIGAKKNAKRAAFIHLYFNLIGTLIFITVYYALNAIFHFPLTAEAATPAGIAIVHSAFNILCTLFWLPFNKVLVKLACMTVRGSDDDEVETGEFTQELSLLDERFLERPAFAVAQVVAVSNRMAELTRDCLNDATGYMLERKPKMKKRAVALEAAIDLYEDQLGSYLVKLSGRSLSLKDSETVSTILHSISNFERISDHSLNLVETTDDMIKDDSKFSAKAMKELQIYISAVREIVNITVNAFTKNDLEAASSIEPLEEVIDNLNSKAKKHHVKRMQSGECTMGLSVLIEDTYINLERISDHCSNIGVTLIQVSEDEFDTHEYLDTLREERTPAFAKKFEAYKTKYHF
ncbi:MAG: Na/Pi cotransporter family protein [Lachnospiraceae bacterium]|nr:Na/Pi cotransporter family protein [Lachnospiraceae bacterium]